MGVLKLKVGILCAEFLGEEVLVKNGKDKSCKPNACCLLIIAAVIAGFLVYAYMGGKFSKKEEIKDSMTVKDAIMQALAK